MLSFLLKGNEREAIRECLRVIKAKSNCSFIWLGYWDEDNEKLVFTDGCADESSILGVFNLILGHKGTSFPCLKKVISSGEPVYCRELPFEPGLKGKNLGHRYGINRFLLCPLSYRDTAIGVLVCGWAADRGEEAIYGISNLEEVALLTLALVIWRGNEKRKGEAIRQGEFLEELWKAGYYYPLSPTTMCVWASKLCRADGVAFYRRLKENHWKLEAQVGIRKVPSPWQVALCLQGENPQDDESARWRCLDGLNGYLVPIFRFDAVAGCWWVGGEKVFNLAVHVNRCRYLAVAGQFLLAVTNEQDWKKQRDEEICQRLRELEEINSFFNYNSSILEQISREVANNINELHSFAKYDLVNQMEFIHQTINRIGTGPQFLFYGFYDEDKEEINGYLIGDCGREEASLLDEEGFLCKQKTKGVFVLNYLRKVSSRLENGKVIRLYNGAGVFLGKEVLAAFNFKRPVVSGDGTLLQQFLLYHNLIRQVMQNYLVAEDSFKYMVQALARVAEGVDDETGQHINRIASYSYILAAGLGLKDREVEEISFFSQMHDVGKIFIHPDILRKPGRLSPAEWEQIRMHPIYGVKILGEHPRLEVARQIALYHHEKWDGSGYPFGIRGEEIPLPARIVALADVYDALRGERPYKRAFTHREAMQAIIEGDGRTNPQHFDPEVLHVFVRVAKEIEAVSAELGRN